MAKTLDKHLVLRCLRARLAEVLARLTAAQTAAQSGAVHAEAKQEHPKDTRSTEAGYLSRGLAERVETMQDAVTILEVFRLTERAADAPIRLGDLVALVDGAGREVIHFLAPVGGGEKLVVSGREILVLTPRSPLGAALIGKEPGDEVHLDLPAGKRALEIRWVH
jgi:transcription elongation GreA/GreB family factor